MVWANAKQEIRIRANVRLRMIVVSGIILAVDYKNKVVFNT